MSDFKDRQITGFWEKKSKKGTTYWSGKIDGRWVSMYKNTNKKTDKHPDFQLYWDSVPEQSAGSSTAQNLDLAPNKANDNSEDIPF